MAKTKLYPLARDTKKGIGNRAADRQRMPFRANAYQHTQSSRSPQIREAIDGDHGSQRRLCRRSARAAPATVKDDVDADVEAPLLTERGLEPPREEQMGEAAELPLELAGSSREGHKSSREGSGGGRAKKLAIGGSSWEPQCVTGRGISGREAGRESRPGTRLSGDRLRRGRGGVPRKSAGPSGRGALSARASASAALATRRTSSRCGWSTCVRSREMASSTAFGLPPSIASVNSRTLR